MQKAAKKHKSPYAKPLPFVTPRKRKMSGKKPRRDSKSAEAGEIKSNAIEGTPATYTPDIPGQLLRQHAALEADVFDDSQHVAFVRERRESKSGALRRTALTPYDLEVLVIFPMVFPITPPPPPKKKKKKKNPYFRALPLAMPVPCLYFVFNI